MISTVKHVKTEVKFTFRNGSTYNLSLSSINNETLYNYCTGIRLIERLYSPSTSSIIGQVSSNNLTLDIVSKDKLLISTNKNSLYYGLMDDTAIIEVWCTIVDDNNKKIYLGKYWVDTWENSTRSSSKYEVNISAVNIFNKIKQISLERVKLNRNISFKNYLIIIINKLNENLNENMKIKYNDEDLDIFNRVDLNWEMYYNNIDRDNIEIIFNNIAQNSLSYIWIDREGYIKTDCLINDKEDEIVASFSGDKDIFNYELTNGSIYQYSGVKVEYIDNVSYSDECVLSMNKTSLNKGLNTITTNFDTDKVVNVNHIEIEIDGGYAICTSFFNYKNTIEMNIRSSILTSDANIYVYGTVVKENFDSIVKYKDTNNKNSLLDINNYILRKECINEYISGLIQLISMENGQLIIEGYINPEVRLDNIISMKGTTLDINGYYKVIGLEYNLGSSYRCKATLLKTISTVPDVDTMLYDDNIAVINMQAGVNISEYNFKNLNEAQEELVDNELGSILEELNSYLEGE